MGYHRLSEPGVEDGQGLVESLPVLLGRNADLDQLLRHATGAADLQPPARQVVEHADLLQNAPRLVERQHHAHGAEPKPLGAASDAGAQQVAPGAMGEAEMVLAEEDTFESEPVDALPKGDTRIEHRRGGLWRDLLSRGARCIQELEDPRLDHAPPWLRPIADLG